MAGRQKTTFNSMTKGNGKYIGYVAVGLIAVVLVWGFATDFKFLPQTIGNIEPPATTTATTFVFNVEDYKTYATPATADYDINMYKLDTTGMDADEKAEAESDLDQYTADGIKHDGDSYAPAANHSYLCLVNGSDFRSYWFVPKLGMNNIQLVNASEDMAIVYYSDQYVTTFNQTTNRTWNIMVAQLDADGKITEKEGISDYFDYATDYTNSLVLRVEFNTTAQLSWCNLETEILGVTEKAAGNYVYYEIPGYYFGEDNFQIKLGSTIGTSFEAVGIAAGYGSSESMTVCASGN